MSKRTDRNRVAGKRTAPNLRREGRWKEAAAGVILGWLAGLGALDLVRGVLPILGSDILVPVAAVLGAALALTPLRRGLWITSAVIVAGLAVVSYTPLVSVLMPGVIRSDPLEPAPAVVVLAATIQKDGELSAASQARLLEGYRVLRAGSAPRLVLTQGKAPFGSYVPVVRQQMRDLGLQYPIDETEPIGNTYEEAVAVARLAREKGWRRIILVTHPWHMRRAAGVFEKAGLEVIGSPCVEGNYDLTNLDSPSARLLAFRDWAHEAIGYQVYRLRGWL